jgi:hypothetical protein
VEHRRDAGGDNEGEKGAGDVRPKRAPDAARDEPAQRAARQVDKMVAGYLMTSGFKTSPSRNCTGPKARGAISRLRTT